MITAVHEDATYTVAWNGFYGLCTERMAPESIRFKPVKKKGGKKSANVLKKTEQKKVGKKSKQVAKDVKKTAGTRKVATDVKKTATVKFAKNVKKTGKKVAKGVKKTRAT